MNMSTPEQPILYSFRNRSIRSTEIDFIKGLIEQHPTEGRSRISRRICETWDWRHPGTGHIKDMACRDLLLRLEERGFIKLPPPKIVQPGGYNKRVNLANHPLPVTIRPIESGDLSRVSLRLITTPEERLDWRALIDRYHYLGDKVIPGENRLYFAMLEDEIVGCVSWSAAVLHCPARDAYIGWDFDIKRQRLHLVANNQRFLIFPWVNLHGLGSRILSLSLKRLSADWEQAYRHPIALAETFVDCEQFIGTVYRAANWMYMGMTRGKRERRGNKYLTRYEPKDIYLFPLTRHFREMLLGTYRE
jgi:hypothetical protein